MAETVYVPGSSAKARDTQFGEVIKLSFKYEDLGAFAKKYKNAKGYVNLEVAPRKTPGKYGDTHSVKLDNWEPKEDGGKPAAKPAPRKTDPFEGTGAPVGQKPDDDDEPPF